MADKSEKSKIELKKISYKSAVFFGIIALVVYLIMGILQVFVLKRTLSSLPEYAALVESITPLASLIIAPIVAGAVCSLFALLVILIYNLTAKNFPISWEIKK